MGKKISRDEVLKRVNKIQSNDELREETRKFAAEIILNIESADEAYKEHTAERNNVATARSALGEAKSNLTKAKQGYDDALKELSKAEKTYAPLKKDNDIWDAAIKKKYEKLLTMTYKDEKYGVRQK